MHKKRAFYLLFILAFTAVNAYILINRNEGFKYYPYKTYNEIYVTDSTLYLKDLYFASDSLQLFFSLPLPFAQYYLAVDSGAQKHIIAAKKDIITIPVFVNLHTYILMPVTKEQTAITLIIDHDTLKNPVINELLFCSLPGPQIKVSAMRTWMQGHKNYSEKDLANAREMLKEKTGFYAQHSDSEAVMVIAKFCASLCNQPKGLQGDALGSLAPYRQIQEAAKCNAWMDCGNYSTIFQYLATAAGLPNRVVTYQGPAGNWRYGVHYMNEVYLRQQQQWVLIDALNNIYMPQDSIRFYNAADLKKMNAVNSFAAKNIYTFINDTARLVPYESMRYQHQYYNQTNSNLVYLYPGSSGPSSEWNNIVEFYTFGRGVAFYNDNNSNDWVKIILKETTLVILLASIFMYILFEWHIWKKKRALH